MGYLLGVYNFGWDQTLVELPFLHPLLMKFRHRAIEK
jgi:hypothetical protein